MNVEIPTWPECNEKQECFERSDRTIMQAVMFGSELTPLESFVLHYDDSDVDRSKEFRIRLKLLVEWCVNNPIQVRSMHEVIS